MDEYQMRQFFETPIQLPIGVYENKHVKGTYFKLISKQTDQGFNLSLIDCDEQGNDASNFFMIPKNDYETGVLSFICGEEITKTPLNPVSNEPPENR